MPSAALLRVVRGDGFGDDSFNGANGARCAEAMSVLFSPASAKFCVSVHFSMCLVLCRGCFSPQLGTGNLLPCSGSLDHKILYARLVLLIVGVAIMLPFTIAVANNTISNTSLAYRIL